MRFQYFALISTEMRGTYVHLPVVALMCGLKLNNRYGHMAIWYKFTADYLDPIYNFLPYLKVNFLDAKIVENLTFFNFKKLCCNYLPFISPFRALYH